MVERRCRRSGLDRLTRTAPQSPYIHPLASRFLMRRQRSPKGVSPRSTDLFDPAIELPLRIRSEFLYDPEATEVNTPAVEAFQFARALAPSPPTCSKANVPKERVFMADQTIPHFHNDLGVPSIKVGVKEFMCTGAKPPFDHPHIFIDMGSDVEAICSYCSTRFVYDGELTGPCSPAECELSDVA